MLSLPEYIIDALEQNQTSLGKHPSFPPEQDGSFIACLTQDIFEKICEKVGEVDYETAKSQLGKMLGECKKIERSNIQSLEKVCANIVNDMFHIPQDTIEINMNIVDKIDTKAERMYPEKADDFSFDDIEDINNLTQEIYKRRMLNVLVEGASMYYMNFIGKYVNEIFEINSDLPSLYKKILDYNNMLLYIEKDHLEDDKHSTSAGKVDVIISSIDTYPIIKAEGLIFPILLGETIKGLLELAIAHGLPNDMEKAKYITKKADFKLAEMWDMRLGLPLWCLIEKQVKECGYDMLEIGINFFLMQLAEMDCDTFNKSLQEIFASTRKGKEILSDIAEEILYNKEKDDFDDYIQQQNDKTILIGDDDCYTAEELLVDDEEECFTPQELINDSLYENVLTKNLNESEWNYHFSKLDKEHTLEPYVSDNKLQMAGRETGHFGSGTYFSTFPEKGLNGKYKDNQTPNFIKVGENTYRVDFDLYKNLYRVKSKKQGDILYTMCYSLNRMYNNIAYRGEFKKKDAKYDNAYLYQIIKANADALNLKCPSYYELTRMAQNHKGEQSFSTLFMEYNGYNGVNVSGIDYYDNTKHGSVIYDLSKVGGEMEQVNPKSLFSGFNQRSYNNTIAQTDYDDAVGNSLAGDYPMWQNNLNDMPMNKALRLLKNYTMNGKTISDYSMLNLNNKLLERYLRILYTSITNKWQYYDDIEYAATDYENISSFIEAINKTKSYYWANLANGKISMLIEMLKRLPIDWDLTVEEENRQKKEYLDMLLGYLNRGLTKKEKEYIEKNYYEEL